MSFWTYMLRCSDGSYYVGHTDELQARMVAHDNGYYSGYTRSRRPVSLVWCEEFSSRNDAFQRERQVKGWSRWKKERLIAADWDALRAGREKSEHLPPDAE